MFSVDLLRSQFSFVLPETDMRAMFFIYIGQGLAVILALPRMVYPQEVITIHSEESFIQQLLKNFKVVGSGMEQQKRILGFGRKVE